jgi:hypothetical protein
VDGIGSPIVEVQLVEVQLVEVQLVEVQLVEMQLVEMRLPGADWATPWPVLNRPLRAEGTLGVQGRV